MWDGISYFLKMCWGYNKKYILFLSLIQITQTGLTVVSLFIPQTILDTIFTYGDFKKAVVYISVFMLWTLILNVLSQHFLKKSSNERMKTYNIFQIDLAKKMMSAKLERIESQYFLSQKAKAEQYLYGGGQGFASVLEKGFEIVGLLLSLIIYGFIVTKLHIAVLVILVIIIIINLRFNYYYQEKNVKINMEKAVQERKSAYYNGIFQDFSYGKEIRAYDLREWLLEKYKIQLNKMVTFYQLLNRNNFIYSTISILIQVLQQCVSYGYLLFQTFKAGITVGSFSLYMNAISSFNSTIKSLVSLIVSLKQYSIYYDAYREYINIENIFNADRQDLLIPENENLIFEFVNVSFKYPLNDYYSLKNVNIKINKGDKIAIVGKNGAGKSTFIKLILRIYQPTEGTILLNGKDINEISYTSYLKIFSTVFQDYKLFAESVKENIVFEKNAKDDKSINDILNAVGLGSKVSKLKNGINTSVYKTFSDEGYIPSEGEAQKIAFARALYKDASVAILDEPSSSLDPQSEMNIYQIFKNMSKEKTCLFISHRLSISNLCNRVLVFDGGILKEEGTHKELMNNRGLYYSLYSMQTQYYDKSK